MVDEEEQETCPICIRAIVRVAGRAAVSARSALVQCPRCGVKACQAYITVDACLDVDGDLPTEDANSQARVAVCCNAPKCSLTTTRPTCLDYHRDHEGWACSKFCLVLVTEQGKVPKERVPKTCLECIHVRARWREHQQLARGETFDVGPCLLLDLTYNVG